MNDIIKIEVQYFNGCPNSPEMIRRIKEAIKGKEEIIDYNEVLVESNELAEKLKFRGSPTVLINGEDIEGREEAESAALNCRVYENGLPGIEEIKKRIFN
ncbi:MAG: thioredoxin family protein [Ignavibacteriaceae bacterium]